MTDYLLFRLYGPLASWGEPAVGESRHSAMRPSRSALLGLLGAALGIKRDDDEGQRRLVEGYRFAVKLVCSGMPLRDYHTVQAPPQQRKVIHRTRRQALSDTHRLGALLSSREYRCDSLSIVAVQAVSTAPHDLPALQHALRYPHFTLCLGRKSAPLALPLDPRLVSSSDAKAALDTPLPSLLALGTRTPDETWSPKGRDRLLSPSPPRYYWDDGVEAGVAADMSIMRNDQPLSRRRWQFSPRIEWSASPDEDRP